MDAAIAYILVALATVFFATRHYLLATQDQKEPPLLETTIPFITPVIGTFRKKNGYYAQLRDRYRAPIYTLRYPGFRLYVINTPQLISAVQRQHKALTFQGIEDKFGALVCRLSPEAKAIQSMEMDIWQKAPVNAPSPAHTMFKALNPGRHLDAMNRRMMETLVESTERMIGAIGVDRVEKVSLYEWIKREVTIATTDGVYGPKNPYRDVRARNAFWDFESGTAMQSFGLIGRLLAAKSVAGHKTLSSIFEQYFREESHLQGSGLTQERYEWYNTHSYPMRDICNLEAGNGLAILPNTVATAFWLLFHIFSSPENLEMCRAEVLSHVVSSTDADGTPIRALDVSKLRTSCPKLLSAFKEALRFHSSGIGLRQVMQDHVLDGTYLLKKDAIIMMPAAVQHTDAQVWGPTVSSYDLSHFLPDPVTKRQKSNPISFRAFGGGATLCPGRHFATTEVLVLAAMLMLRLDVKVEGEAPTTKKAQMTVIMAPPDNDVQVEMRTRKEDLGVKWLFSLTESDMPIRIAAEDMEGEEK